MIKAYTIVDESATHTTYQYSTVCSWWLYSTVALLFIGYLVPLIWLSVIAVASVFSYFAVVYFPALKIARRLKAATRNNSVQLSGSRWSFSDPLRVKMLKVTDA